jgi:flavin-dependent dehydrogenase
MWESARPSVTDYELEQCGPGYTIMRPAADRALFQRVESSGATLRRGWTCVRVTAEDLRQPVRADFRTPDGNRAEVARLIIVATGRARIPGTPRRIYVDRQLALAATADGAETHDLLWVEYFQPGWWYLTRISPTRAQIVLVRPHAPPAAGGDARVRCFKDALARTRLIRSAFSVSPLIDYVSVHDARASVPSRPCLARVLLVGDAAGTTDPLSGSGWSRAFESADTACERAANYLRGARALDVVADYQDSAKRFAAHLAGRKSILARGAGG